MEAERKERMERVYMWTCGCEVFVFFLPLRYMYRVYAALRRYVGHIYIATYHVTFHRCLHLTTLSPKNPHYCKSRIFLLVPFQHTVSSFSESSGMEAGCEVEKWCGSLSCFSFLDGKGEVGRRGNKDLVSHRLSSSPDSASYPLTPSHTVLAYPFIPLVGS